jgi:hypothetical protein
MPGGLGIWVIIATTVVIALLLLHHYLTRDSDVQSTRFGFYIERRKYLTPQEEYMIRYQQAHRDTPPIDPTPDPTDPQPQPGTEGDDTPEDERQTFGWPHS